MVEIIIAFLNRILPWVFAVAGLLLAIAGRYDQAAYNMAAGVFFMVLPQYLDYMEIRRR